MKIKHLGFFKLMYNNNKSKNTYNVLLKEEILWVL
jgi:hypothetical protein